MTDYAYGIYDGENLAVFDYKLRIYWHRAVAKDNCPSGFTVRKVRISTVSKPDSKGGETK